jgi:hypothetical protein
MPGRFTPREVHALRERMLCDAIRRRHLLEFKYHGLNRVIAPYCHGISTRGTEVLRGVQVAGDSRSGGFNFGKLWAVAEMVDLRISDVSFMPNDPGYDPDDSGMREIHCRI